MSATSLRAELGLVFHLFALRSVAGPQPAQRAGLAMHGRPARKESVLKSLDVGHQVPHLSKDAHGRLLWHDMPFKRAATHSQECTAYGECRGLAWRPKLKIVGAGRWKREIIWCVSKP